MPEYLCIQARLPQAAGLELSARLMAARPHWDIAVDEAGLSFTLDFIRGQMDGELAFLEEACQNFERGKNIEISDFWVSRLAQAPPHNNPAAAGPWRLARLKEGEAAPTPRPDRLILPPEAAASSRFWAGESLALSALAEHLTPPPGAPETRGQAFLALGHCCPLSPTAALWAGAGEALLISDERACALAATVAALNGKSAAFSTVSDNFPNLAKERSEGDGEWQGRFGLIVLHLSPYLAARRLTPLAAWLADGGAIIVSGFAPGPQTAHLLRAAARAGLFLSASATEGQWAAMKLELSPPREELPPLTGSVVPALRDLPPEELAAREEEIPDEESLILDEEETEDNG